MKSKAEEDRRRTEQALEDARADFEFEATFGSSRKPASGKQKTKQARAGRRH